MRIIIAVALYLLGSLFPAMARDLVPDTTRDCQSRLGALGSLIRKHNPTEDHMARLRAKARKVNTLCQDERFKRAHRILGRMKREIQAVHNPKRDFEAERNTSKGKIRKCLDKLHDLGPGIVEARLDGDDERRIKKMGKNMHQNCRLQRFSRAQRDYKNIQRSLHKITSRRAATAENFESLKGCQNKVASLNERLKQQKLSRQIRVWMRKSSNQILRLCKNKKFRRAEREYNNTENDFAKYLREAEKPVIVQAASPADIRNCRRSYTFMFQLINSKTMSNRQRRKLLKKRKRLGSYCYEKDFASAKTLFNEMRRDLAKHSRDANAPVVRLTARNCARKIDNLKRKANNMGLTSRDLNGLAIGRKRIQSYCDKKNYRMATRWYQRVDKRLARFNKSNNVHNANAPAVTRLTARNCTRKIDNLEKKANNMDLTSRDLNGLATGRKRIQSNCDKKKYRIASRWYERVQKRMAQLKKDSHRVSLQDRPSRNRRSDRREVRHRDHSATVDTKEACMQKQRNLVRKIADDAPSFRIRTKLRGRAIYMRLQCQRRKFSKAMSIHDLALEKLR